MCVCVHVHVCVYVCAYMCFCVTVRAGVLFECEYFATVKFENHD